MVLHRDRWSTTHILISSTQPTSRQHSKVDQSFVKSCILYTIWCMVIWEMNALILTVSQRRRHFRNWKHSFDDLDPDQSILMLAGRLQRMSCLRFKCCLSTFSSRTCWSPCSGNTGRFLHRCQADLSLFNLSSKRFDQVYDETRRIWHAQQYLFTREYYTRSPFFPPISWVFDIYHLIRNLVFFMRRTCFKGRGDRKARVFSKFVEQKAEGWWARCGRCRNDS